MSITLPPPPRKSTRAEILRARSKCMMHLAELDAQLAEIESIATTSDRYSSTCLPPDCGSRRTFGAVCRSGRVAGAVLEGHVWSCPRDAWHAARARKRPMRLAPPRPANDDEAIAAAALEAAGIRSTRRAG